MMLRMMHPRHGWHVPSNSAERESMLAHGWVDEVPHETTYPQVQTPAEVVTVAQTATDPAVKRKPGRPRKNRDDGPADHQ